MDDDITIMLVRMIMIDDSIDINKTSTIIPIIIVIATNRIQ